MPVLDSAQRIYGCKIQRRDMSRLRTISETILALERRVWPSPGPDEAQVDSSYALVQQRQNHTRLWTMGDALHSLSTRLCLS